MVSDNQKLGDRYVTISSEEVSLLFCYVTSLLSARASIKITPKTCRRILELLEMVVSLTSAVSVTWHSVGISLRAATKSVVGDSTGREIRELSVKHDDLKASNNKLILHYVTAQFIYIE